MAVAAAAIGAVVTTGFANSPEPLALILREIGKPWAARVLGAAAVIALPTVILAFFYGQSRIFFVVARDGLLPSSLARVSQPRHARSDHDLHRDRDVDFRGPDPARRRLQRSPMPGLSPPSSPSARRCSCFAAANRTASASFATPLAPLVGTVGILGCIYLFISLPNRTQLFFVAGTGDRPVPLRDLRQPRRGAGPRSLISA